MYNDSGIYCYRNKINGKLYVGQATNFKTRYINFYNTNQKYAGSVIENARRKYGTENFEYTILTHCPVNELNYWESFYIERLNCVTPKGYNMTNGGDSVYMSTREFKDKQGEILKAKILSKNCNLDVSKVQYKGERNTVTIICPIHGPFKKTPSYFKNPEINNLCCPKCVKEYLRQKSENNFIQSAKDKWGNKYDYSKTIFIDRATPITITCPIHGDFTVLPGNHICKDENTGGCQKCSEERLHNMAMEIGENKLIEKIKEKFGDKYSLEKFVYKGDKEKVTLVCPIHGDFSMRAHNLLKSYGCPKCSKHYMDEEFFIETSQKVHNNEYDYSKVNYVTAKTPVCIICKEHGEFWQTPRVHMNGSGCPLCARLKQALKKTKGNYNFIKEAKEIHGDKYDYSKVEYLKYNENVCIICPKHGEFWQKPGNHLSGNGCPKCSKELKTKTTEQFIKEAKEKHGNMYDYSKVNYINNCTKVCIICPEHGEFWQKPNDHLRGYGCRKCREKNFKPTPKDIFINKVNELYPNIYTFEKCNYVNKNTYVTLFDKTINQYVSAKPDELVRRKPKTINLINKLKEKFGNKYDYSKVEYVTDKQKICVICPIHGEFSARPRNLLNSYGCPKCTLKNTLKNKYNGETNETIFINKAKIVHGDKYDYSKVNYIKSLEKVCIICPEHGEFWQTPNNHLNGYGCPKCGTKFTNKRKIILQYTLNGTFIKEWENYDEIIKAGITNYVSHIKSCCNGKRNKACGFIWKHKEDTSNSIEPSILQLTKDNVLIKKWNNMSEIRKNKPIKSTQHIIRCLKGTSKTAGGFIWKYDQ